MMTRSDLCNLLVASIVNITNTMAIIRQVRFRNWVVQHKDMIYSHALYYTGNAADAADIVQEVFLKLWSHVDDISGKTVKSWLLKVAHNQCIDLSRKTREVHMPVHVAEDGSVRETEFSDRDSDTPEDEALLMETRHRVRQTILKLPPRLRACIVMRELQEMSYAEIAQTLEIPLNTVKANIHRGRKMLKQLLLRQHTLGGTGE